MVAVAAVLVLLVFLVAPLRVRVRLMTAADGFSASRFDHVQFSLLNFAMAESEMIVMATASRALPGDFLLLFSVVSRVGRLVCFMRTMLDHWSTCFFIVTTKL